MKIVTPNQMRRIEARCQRANVSMDFLMEQAGLGVARQILDRLKHISEVSIVVLVGSGSNGGDGLVAARHLQSWGANVMVYLCSEREDSDAKLILAREQDLTVRHGSLDEGFIDLKKALMSANFLVDAVIGTGFNRPIEGPLKAILREVAEAKSGRPDLLILALDMPTGLNSETGITDPLCLAADVTIALGYPKVGLFASRGAEMIGDLEIVDIGIPVGLDEDVNLQLMTSTWAKSILPHRSLTAHKGNFGRALVVAGSSEYVGAAYLAAAAATRVGAGLVTIAIPRSLQMAVAAKISETTYLPLPESSPGVVSPEALPLIIDNIAEFDALLVGCGMGQTPAARKMIEGILYTKVSLPPTVVDADGLNILSLSLFDAESCNWWDKFATRAIVTPHPREMARLMGDSSDLVQNDRVGVATDWAMKSNKVTVLKGAHTIVAFTDGSGIVSPFANPGLASAGTGDVLAGVIVGLLCQGLQLEDAASLGVYLHGESGDRVREVIGDTGMIASDLLPVIPRVIQSLRNEG